MGKTLILIGAFILIIGIILNIAENENYKWLSWFGNLPGDIKIEKENFKFYFPLTSMILISIILSLLIKVIKKFF